MKARPFLAAVLAVAVALLAVGAVAWWGLLQGSPLSLQDQRLTLPVAARFVPRTAPLSLHWLVGPDQPAAYARAVAPPRQRRQAAAAMERLRDGAFAAAGLDYATELAPWLGGQSSFALLTPPDQGGPPGWVLALRSRDNAGARRFLQRFWQTRSLAGTDLQISSYRGMGLISGRGALVGQEPRPLATALINDDLVLIASGRGVLEQALDVSQIDELNQASSPQLQQAIRRLERGVALLTARPSALQRWLGLPASFAAEGTPARELVAALTPAGQGLSLEALLQLQGPLPTLRLSGSAGSDSLLRPLHTPATSLAVLQDPARLLTPSEPDQQLDPWQQLFGPLFSQVMAKVEGPLPALVAAADAGPLLWSQQPEGWLLATRAEEPALEPLQSALATQGYSQAPLQSKGQTLQAWTKLQSKPVKGNPDQLQAQLAGALALEAGWAWWGQGLGVLNQQHEGRQAPQQRLDQLASLGAPQAPLQWAMDGPTARRLLARWQPWRLMTTLSSTPLGPVVDGAALSLEGEQDLLHLHASLQLR
jgi:hypothetical protein